MEVFTTKLESVLLIKPPTVFEDFRGHYIETYNRSAYFTAGIPIEFIQDDISTSHRHVLRGIHGDTKTWKLISCLQGSFYMVVVNNDPSSSQYRRGRPSPSPIPIACRCWCRPISATATW